MKKPSSLVATRATEKTFLWRLWKGTENTKLEPEIEIKLNTEMTNYKSII